MPFFIVSTMAWSSDRESAWEALMPQIRSDFEEEPYPQ